MNIILHVNINLTQILHVKLESSVKVICMCSRKKTYHMYKPTIWSFKIYCNTLILPHAVYEQDFILFIYTVSIKEKIHWRYKFNTLNFFKKLKTYQYYEIKTIKDVRITFKPDKTDSNDWRSQKFKHQKSEKNCYLGFMSQLFP